MRRVLVSNVYADDNRGGAALTAAAVLFARQVVPDCRVTLLTLASTAEEVARDYEQSIAREDVYAALPRLLPGRDRGSLRALVLSLACLTLPRRAALRRPRLAPIAEADLVVGKGGHMFRDRGRGGVLGLWFACLPLLLAQRWGIPTVVLGQSFGPFKSRLVARLSAAVVRRVDTVLLRDPVSVSRAQELGVPRARLGQVPDSVFLLPAPSGSAVTDACRAAGVSPRRFAVVTASYKMLTSRGPSLGSLADLARALVTDGMVDEVLVVLQVTGHVADDRTISQELVRLVDDRRVRFYDGAGTWEHLSALYGGAAVVVGARLHSALLAILAGRPAFPLEVVDGKASEVLAGVSPDLVTLDLGSISNAVGVVSRAIDASRERDSTTADRCRADVETVALQLRASM